MTNYSIRIRAPKRSLRDPLEEFALHLFEMFKSLEFIGEGLKAFGNDISARKKGEITLRHRVSSDELNSRSGGTERIIIPTNIESLNLGGYYLPASALGEVTKHLKELREFRFMDIPQGSKFAGLAELTNLTLLHLGAFNYTLTGYTPTLTGYIFHPISRLTKLEDLELSELHLGGNNGSGFSGIEKLTNLKTLAFRSSYLGDEGLKSIGKLTNLETLIFDDCNCGINAKGLSYLSGLSKLKTLDLHRVLGRMIGDAEVAEIAKLPALETLDLNGNERITDASISSLAEAPSLKTLDLYGTGITAKGINQMAEAIKAGKFTKLETLTIMSFNQLDNSRQNEACLAVVNLQSAAPNLKINNNRFTKHDIARATEEKERKANPPVAYSTRYVSKTCTSKEGFLEDLEAKRGQGSNAQGKSNSGWYLYDR